jgi:uncharacterized membrane-anchored protein
MMRVVLPIFLVALLQSGLALSGLVTQMRVIWSGTEVVLATQAIDPRDLLRGHYVTLRLVISDLPSTLPGDRPLPQSPVWVRLAPGPDGLWQATALAATDPDGVAIRGTYLGDYGQTHSLYFDIARYYAPKDRALALEDAMRRGTVGVILALGPDGVAVLRGVVIDGVRHLDRLF